MGNCKSACSASALPWAPTRETTVLLLGLDSAGKSTLLANMNGESTDGITPTIGFASSNLDIGKFEVTMYDLGGGPRIRGIWKNYYPEAHGIVFVVDASAPQRLDEAKDVLNTVMQHQKVGGKPLLIFANKQDQDGAVDETELSNRLELDTLMGDNRPYSNVVKCIAHKSASGNRSDSSIKQGMRWLLNTIGSQFDNLNERVRADVIEQKAIEAQQRKERAERVRRIREERERQQALSGENEEDHDGDQDGSEISNPFRPIAQVAQEAEEREKAAKAARKAKKQTQQVMVDVEPQVSSVAESTNNEHSEIMDNRHQQSVSLPETEEAKVTKSSSQSTIVSQTTSGLSESSDSLTDVTPQSHGSSDSLHLSAPSQSNAPTTHEDVHEEGGTDTHLEHVQADGTGKGKKRNRKMLLSRLKNRNKTAPAPLGLPHSLPNVQNAAQPVLSKRDTWTGPELEAVVITPPHTPTPQPSPQPLPHTQGNQTHQQLGDPLAGLPALPRNRHVLPPLKVFKIPAGMGDTTFHLSEDITALPPSSITPLSQPPPPLTASSLDPVAA